MLLVELQLGRVLDGDDAVLHRDEAGQHVQERRLAGAGATDDDDVGLGQHGRLEEAERGLIAGAEPDQVLNLVRVARELTDREQWSVEGQRADDCVDTGAVSEAGVTEGRALVDAPPDGAHDELDHVEELVLVDELDVGQDDLAAHLDVDVVAAVDHDLGDSVIADQRLDGPKLLVVLIDVDSGDPDCHWLASAVMGTASAPPLYRTRLKSEPSPR